MILTTKQPLWAAENSLTTNTTLATEGYFVLSWSTDFDSVTLLQSNSSDFQNPFAREIPGSGEITITGLTDGDYHFRLQRDGGAVSNLLTVSVLHHSLTRALLFFLLGLALFITLVTTILIGTNRARD